MVFTFAKKLSVMKTLSRMDVSQNVLIDLDADLYKISDVVC